MILRRRWQFVILAVVIVCLLSAISYFATLNDVYAVNDYYVIMRDGDGFKLLMTDYGSKLEALVCPDLSFKSIAEMEGRVMEGSFTTDEASAFNYFYPSGGLYKDCIDFDDLYDAVLPSPARLKQVTWGGTSYYYLYFTHALSASPDYIVAVDSSQFRHYREYVNKEYYEHTDAYTYIKETQVSDRNATAHYFSHTHIIQVTDYVDLCYELTTEDKILYVQERFEVSEYQRNGAPYEINILGKQEDYYYNLHFEDLKRRPTEDWLLSFGLKPYVEQE